MCISINNVDSILKFSRIFIKITLRNMDKFVPEKGVAQFNHLLDRACL